VQSEIKQVPCGAYVTPRKSMLAASGRIGRRHQEVEPPEWGTVVRLHLHMQQGTANFLVQSLH
jgi:hypothetical protein